MKLSNPTAAVLIIGDEILSGRTADTNLNTLAKFLAGRGIELKEARVVGDSRADIIKAVNRLRFGYDFLFTTGGIGPTHDDITAQCVAEAFGVELPYHPEALAVLEKRYGDEFNDARRKMARIPQGATLIANPVTDAPGFQIGNVFVMAGVPKIMQGMLKDIEDRLPRGELVVSRSITIKGVGEGVIAAPLAEAARRRPNVSIGSYPHLSASGSHIQVVIRGTDEAEVEEAEAELRALFESETLKPLEVLAG